LTGIDDASNALEKAGPSDVPGDGTGLLAAANLPLSPSLVLN
tara:strand:- start:472 stop:597 length:126 start_codon:yes stop_codon:yes gene_type:complete